MSITLWQATGHQMSECECRLGRTCLRWLSAGPKGKGFSAWFANRSQAALDTGPGVKHRPKANTLRITRRRVPGTIGAEDVIEMHYWDGDRLNNRCANLGLLHGHCHDEIHGRRC